MKKLKTRLVAFAMGIAMLISVAACGQDTSTTQGNEASTKTDSDVAKQGKDPADYKIVLLLSGPINDQSWNATNYAGLLACNETLGTNMEYVENIQASDYEATFREYSERGYDLILAAGSQFDEPVAVIAPNYPDTTFCVVNGTRADGDNVAPIFPKEFEASYIASIIAGNVTENGNFATIGGFPNEPMENLLSVYEKNAVAVAKERGLADAKATRSYANSWDDVALGKQIADQMIDNGADTVFAYANEVTLGCIEAARSKGVKFIGFSSDQNSIDPNTVVASVVFDFEKFYIWAIEQYINGDLKGNMIHEAGIAEDIFVPVYTDNINQETKDAVETGISEYKAGNVDLQALF